LGAESFLCSFLCGDIGIKLKAIDDVVFSVSHREEVSRAPTSFAMFIAIMPQHVGKRLSLKDAVDNVLGFLLRFWCDDQLIACPYGLFFRIALNLFNSSIPAKNGAIPVKGETC